MPDLSRGRGHCLEGRPSPRLAGWLSAMAPGLGQLYLGRIPEAVLYLGAWLVSVIGMLDVLPTFRGHLNQVPYGLAALAIGLLAYLLGIGLAVRAARRMDRPGAVWRRLAGSGLIGPLRRHLCDLLLCVGFMLLAVGHLKGLALASGLAEQFSLWMVFELGGATLFLFQVALVEVWEHLEIAPHRRVGYLLGFYLVLFAGAALFTRFTLSQLASSALLILPGHAFRLLRSDGSGRERFKLEFAAVVGALFSSLCIVGLTAGFIGVLFPSGTPRHVINAYTHIVLGAVYFLLKLAFAVLLDRRFERQASVHPN